jgi:hypothetical protein
MRWIHGQALSITPLSGGICGICEMNPSFTFKPILLVELRLEFDKYLHERKE